MSDHGQGGNPRRSRSTTIVASSLVLVTGYVFFVATLRSPRFAGDTVAMTQSAQSLVECARHGQFMGCAGANQYGVLQNIPAIFMAWKGLSLESIVSVLGFMNLMAFLGLVVLVWRNLGRSIRGLGVLALLAGPLIGYVSLSFGEMLQTLVFVGFVIAVARKRWGWILLTGVLAASTRETAFLPMALIAFGVIWVTTTDDARKRKLSLLFSGAGIAGGVALITVFNYWKFGTWKNLGNLNSAYVTPGIGRKLDSFIAIWFAPGGGVAPFWLIGAVLSLGVLVTFIILGTRAQRIGSLAIGAGLGASTASLAAWFAPFGWVAWGPRLMMPTVACVLVANLLVFEKVFEVVMIRSVVRRAFVTSSLTAASMVSASASFGYLRNPSVIDRFFAPDKVCSKVAIIQEDPTYYFKCLHYGAWKMHPSLWSVGLDAFGRWEAVALCLLALGMSVAVFALLTPVGPEVEDLDESESIA